MVVGRIVIKIKASDPRWREMDTLATAFCAIANPNLPRVQKDVEPILFRQIRLTLEQVWKEYTTSEDFHA